MNIPAVGCCHTQIRGRFTAAAASGDGALSDAGHQGGGGLVRADLHAPDGAVQCCSRRFRIATAHSSMWCGCGRRVFVKSVGVEPGKINRMMILAAVEESVSGRDWPCVCFRVGVSSRRRRKECCAAFASCTRSGSWIEANHYHLTLDEIQNYLTASSSN